MRAIAFAGAGGNEVVRVEERPDPVPGSEEVLVRVRYAGLNPADTAQRAGHYPAPPGSPPDVPGLEVAGTIEACGAAVTTWRPGERVFGLVGGGGLASLVPVHERCVARVPDSLDEREAAAVPEAFITAHDAIMGQCGLRPGETLLVLGASGGTGLAAIELGKQMGARVIACASSAEKLAFAREHGADATVNYAEEDLKDALKRLTEGRGADVIYDPVGGPYTEPALRSIAWQGRFLVIGFAAGEIPRLPLNLVLLKGCDVVGVFWGAWIERDKAGHRANMQAIVRWAAEGKLSAHVHAAYPLARTADAIKSLSDRKVMGKVVLRP